jgi:transposase-like protein
MFKPIPKEIREQILARIKTDGVNANKAATDAGVSPKTVYGWLTKEAGKTDCNIIEFNRLKKQNEGLYQIIGKLTAEIEKSKRGRLQR